MGLWEAMGAMVLGAIACAIHRAMVSIFVRREINLDLFLRWNRITRSITYVVADCNLDMLVASSRTQ